VRWHWSTLKAAEGPGLCSVIDPTCDAPQCETESGQPYPSGVARSSTMQIMAGNDYSISFDLLADLSQAEGAAGWEEAFAIDMVVPNEILGDLLVARLVCHSGECTTLAAADPCANGINFNYPGCGTPEGDYFTWRHYNFAISDLLCTEALTSPIAQTYLDVLQATGSVDFYLRIEFKSLSGTDDCNTGLYLDEVRFNELLQGFDAECPAWK